MECAKNASYFKKCHCNHAIEPKKMIKWATIQNKKEVTMSPENV